MNLKAKYILFVVLTVLIFATLTGILYQYNKYLFIVGESIIVATIVLSFIFYKSILRPYKILDSGIESIADKDFSIKFLPVGQPEPDRLIEVYNKMIDQLRLERTSATETHFFLEKLIEASPTGIVILDKQNNIEKANPVARGILNLASDNDKITLAELNVPWSTELANLNENDTNVVQVDGLNQYKCYKSVFLDRGIKRTFFIIEELTKDLLRAEKKAYEKVIRMISHEINNSMGAVNSIICSTTAYLENTKENKANDFINALEVAKQRINNLNYFTQRFAEVVRIPQPELNNCNLVDVVNQQLVCFYAELESKKISVKTHFEKDRKVWIQFDIQQLELVLVNIIKNAIQAIGSEGSIDIYIKESPLELSIQNNGIPIAEEEHEKLFTPFFTTKKEGQGIGLTLIREILLNHNCRFSLKTRDDSKTEFRIAFTPL